MKKKLTPTQRKIYSYIKRYTTRNGEPPSYGDIAAYMGYRSHNAAFEAVRAIARKGCLSTTPGEIRGIVVL